MELGEFLGTVLLGVVIYAFLIYFPSKYDWM